MREESGPRPLQRLESRNEILVLVHALQEFLRNLEGQLRLSLPDRVKVLQLHMCSVLPEKAKRVKTFDECRRNCDLPREGPKPLLEIRSFRLAICTQLFQRTADHECRRPEATGSVTPDRLLQGVQHCFWKIGCIKVQRLRRIRRQQLAVAR